MRSMLRLGREILLRPYSTGELFAISLGVIAINYLVFIYCPTSHILEDEIAFYDTIWRNVSGQSPGRDYHNPLGFGPFQLAAGLWKTIGAHDYLLKLANTLLAIPVALIACIAARRYTLLPPPFALLFCIVTAFELSAPSSFGFGLDPAKVGATGFYNRLSIAGLSVLFLFAFSEVNRIGKATWRAIAADVVIAAALLLWLFLFKVSALAIGVCILFAGAAAYRNKLAGFAVAAASVAVAGVLMLVTMYGLNIGVDQVVSEYALASKAKGAPGFLAIYQALFKDPLFGLSVVLLLFGAYVLSLTGVRAFLALASVLVTFVASTFLLNIANEYETIWMFPPALAIMAAIARGYVPAGENSGGENRAFGPGFAFMPIAAFLVVLAGQAMGTLTGTLSDLAVAAGLRDEYVLTADKGTAFRTFCSGDGCNYEQSITDGIALLRANGLTQEKIATLSHSNPFPALLHSPPHRGTQVWWNFGFNVPKDAELGWEDVLGDATVVMVPLTGDYPHVREKLLHTVSARLASQFDLVHADKDWKIYREKR